MTLLLALEGGGGGATFEYAASGGLTLAGAAELARTRAAVAAGGVALAGAATVSRTRALEGAGGLTLAGASDVARVRAWIATGGIVYTGAADTVPPPRTFTYEPTGGVLLAGTALAVFTPGAPEPPPIPSPAPGLMVGGLFPFFARPPRRVRYMGSGGIVFGGEATTAFRPARRWEYVAARAPRRGWSGHATAQHRDRIKEVCAVEERDEILLDEILDLV